MKALDYLISLRDNTSICLPKDTSTKMDEKVSNGSIRRWLNDGGICINGEYPKANDDITFPITSLVFFPKGKRKITMY